MAFDVNEWLIERFAGSNMSPWRIAISDDEAGGPRDFTVDRDGNPDLHTAEFSLLTWDETTAIIDAQACETLDTTGIVIYQATLAEVQAVTGGEKYKVILRIINESGTLEEILAWGQRFRGVPTVTP